MRKLLFSIIFLFICGVAFYYIDPLKMFSIADKEIKNLIDEEYHLPITTTNEPSEKDLITKYKLKQQGTVSEDTSLHSIMNKYENMLQNLKQQVEGKLEKLMNHAYEEYSSKKKEDGSGNLVTLYMKYQKAVDDLEENTDQSFQKVFDQLKTELNQHGYDTSEAEKLKQQYDTIKEETRQVMMRRVMDKFEV